MTAADRAGLWSAPERSGVLVAALLAAGAYMASVGFGFVYDDVYVIEQNPMVHSLVHWWRILTTPYWGPALYRPVTSLSFAFDWTLSGGHPALFHAENVLLHVAATVAVFFLARRYLRPLGATAAAVLFAVHPVHTEAVANIVGRSEVLATLFAVLAVLAYRADGDLAARAVRGGRRWLTSFGALVLVACSVGAKEIGFAVPALLLFTDWIDGRAAHERLGERLARHAVLWIGSVAMTVAFLLVRTSVVGSVAGVDPAPGLAGLGLGSRTLAMLPVVVDYVRLLFAPLHLSADYSPDFLRVVAAVTARAVAGGVLVAAAVAVAVIAARRGAAVVAFGSAWCGAGLLIVSNVLVPSGVTLAERSLYLPSVGLVLVAAWGIEWAASRRPLMTVAAAALVAALGLLRTVTRIPVWRDAQTFFPQLVRDAPGSYRAFWVASAAAYGAGNRERGEALMLRALEIEPMYASLWEYAGARFAEDHRWRRAGEAMGAAFRLDSTRTTTAAQAAMDYLHAGDVDTAEALGERALRVNPDDPNVLLVLGEVQRAKGNALAVMTFRRQAAWRRPDVARYWLLDLEAALDARYCPEAATAVARLDAGWRDARFTRDAHTRLSAAGCGATQ